MNDAGARFQSSIAAFLCGAALATAAGVDWVARAPRLAAAIDASDRARFERGEELYVNRGNFQEFEDRLLIDEIPNADYSRGGVYFFGASNLKWALKTWELPPDERALVGNYGIGAISHSLEAQFIRYLVEKRGLGRAGDGRTEVVLGASWANAVDWDPETYFGPLWRRHRLYTYDARVGVGDAPLGTIGLAYRREKARCAGFLSGNANRAARAVARGLGQPLDPTERMKDPAEVRAWILSRYANLDDRAMLDRQVHALSELVDYLTERRIEVAIALIPRRAAFDDVPFDRDYRNEVTALCAAKGVPLTDLTHLLAEDEYWDINHYNLKGLAKTDAALMSIARDHLRRAGLIAP